ncbi:hypothetical protein D1814_04950 [Alteromonas sp. BL110]|nr:hypothetical protein D1814_04950 [Alteromonas sp. BL110]RKM80807.1 hypothetical protein D7031_18295 [Alteromonas sp. BL110]
MISTTPDNKKLFPTYLQKEDKSLILEKSIPLSILAFCLKVSRKPISKYIKPLKQDIESIKTPDSIKNPF